MNGLAAFIKEQDDGTISLVFNDVEALSESDSPDWKHTVLFTSATYDASAIKGLSLSKEQFAEIGENLITRLLALGGHIR
jgi:hypothetical protein